MITLHLEKNLAMITLDKLQVVLDLRAHHQVVVMELRVHRQVLDLVVQRHQVMIQTSQLLLTTFPKTCNLIIWQR